MQRFTLIFIVIILYSMAVNAATIVVDLAGGGDYTNIATAADDASNGDTVLVMSGTYIVTSEDGAIAIDKELHIVGSGYDLPANGGTTIQSAVGAFYFNANADGSTLQGFRIYGTGHLLNILADDMIIEENFIINAGSAQYYCVYFGASVSSDTLRNNIVGYSSSGSYRYLVALNATTDVTIANNIFFNSAYWGIYPTTGSNNLVMNNLFVNCQNGLTIDGPVTIVNNIFMNGTGSQITNSGGSPSISYNCFFNNSANGSTGIESILDDPDFVDFGDNDTYTSQSYDDDSYDFHLQASSPGIDAGNALFDYFDLDGTRNDVGVYGGPFPIGTTGAPTIPVVNSISVSPTTVSPSGTITINATGRIGE